MTRIKTRQSIAEYLDKRFDFWLEQDQEAADFPDEAEDIERQFIHDWYNELEAYRKAFKAKYKKQIRQNDQWYPRKWMENDELIFRLLRKYPRIPDILNSIEARGNGTDYIYLLHPKGERYKEEYSEMWAAGNRKMKYPLAVFITDARFYDTILTGLGMERITLQKYLRAFYKAGILKRLSNTGKYHNIPIYAVGYFAKWNDKYVLKRFLTIESKTELREFTL